MTTRFQQLNNSANVALAQQIAVLAKREEKKTGKPILYMTMYDIGNTLGVHWLSVSAALRLSYTAEFAQAHGWSFIPPGSGRSGRIYGYALEDAKNVAATREATVALRYTEGKWLDHMNGLVQHIRMERRANRRSDPKRSKLLARAERFLQTAADAVEMAIDKTP